MTDSKYFPALVISLDFELHWGVSEHVDNSIHPYIPHLYETRESVLRLLELFEQRCIHATWATVGKLFARGREDLEAFTPSVLPKYERESVNTYRIKTGSSESEDPLHFAPSLIKQILAQPGQELACHTFCHYYCDEPGQNLSSFQADLEAAQAIAARDGVDLRSLVFPRNQVLADYLSVVQESGMIAYRGNPPGGLYHLPSSGPKRNFIRAIRLADSFVNLTGHHTVAWSHILENKLANVRASHFLRPYSRKLRYLEPLRRCRVKHSLKKAAKQGKIFHLWWHPHNFGANQNENFAALNAIFDEFERLRDDYGMSSLNMSEVADKAMQL